MNIVIGSFFLVMLSMYLPLVWDHLNIPWQLFESSMETIYLRVIPGCFLWIAQPASTCSNLIVETLEEGAKYFTPCSSVSIVNFEQVNAGWEGFM